MRRAAEVRLHWEHRQQLLALAHGRSRDPRVAMRAAMVLRAADGQQNATIAQSLGTDPGTVARWRRRFLAHGVNGIIRDAPRSGRPPLLSGATVDAVLQKTREGRSPLRGRWSSRELARALGLSKSTVQRIWRSHGLQEPAPRPAPRESLAFLDSVTDLVGLYLHPPARAVAFSTDERTALNPFRDRLDHPGAAPSVRSWAVEFRAFLQMTERETPETLDVHLLLDSRVGPVPPDVTRWLSRHPRFHLHVLSSGPVGLSMIDRLIDGFAERKDRPGASASAHRLKYALRDHLRLDRGTGRAFVWTAQSGDIRGAYGRRAVQQ